MKPSGPTSNETKAFITSSDASITKAVSSTSSEDGGFLIALRNSSKFNLPSWSKTSKGPFHLTLVVESLLLQPAPRKYRYFLVKFEFGHKP